MSKDAYYFSHDSNARNDVRMIKLRRMGGLECIGLFWCVVEMLREAENYELPTETIEDICYDFRVDVAKFELLFICNLLVQDDDVFYSKSLKDRMIHLDKVRVERAKAGQKGGKSKANAKQLPSNKSKVKESKEEEIKENNIPTCEDFKIYAKENKPNVDIDSVELKYRSWVENGWKTGNDKPIKNWKNTLLNTLPHMKEVEKDVLAGGKYEGMVF